MSMSDSKNPLLYHKTDRRALYDRALAEARDYKCMACRMTIRPQVFSDIRRGNSIITCESCGRILYFKREPATT